MKVTKLYLTLLFISAALFMYSCESVTNSVPQDDEIFTQEMTLDGSAQTKTNVCHYDAETDAYQLITIADPAVDAHMNHGDAQPGDAVPTMEGFEFDDTCTPQLASIEITECFVDALSYFDENSTQYRIPDRSAIVFEELSWSVVAENESFIQISAPYPFNGQPIELAVNYAGCTILLPAQLFFSGRESSEQLGSASSIGNRAEDRLYLEYLLDL